MIAFDTNLLVYAHFTDSPHHERASGILTEAVQAPAGLALPWPCLHEVLSVVTNPRSYSRPRCPRRSRP